MTLADGFDADVEVEKDGVTAPGTSIMSLMMLAAGIGDTIAITATGPEADAAVAALVDLVETKFGEE
ncbi:phosphocarrier protein [Pacificimonas flava]|uniref:Phosphocarrier protein HPr n=1 Tax=Pacificimonas flava TaxID=1234595 RepID=M2T7B2_9SPHN|nr:phosphocarrier protein HPr [Pacificimonas flava]MBB5281243.1 phosphocarrier protein [Pacificimonas flava]